MGEVLAFKKIASSFLPNDLIGLRAWLKADANVVCSPLSNQVISWGDNSGYLNNFILGGGTNYPLLLQGRGPLSNSAAIFFDNNNYLKNAGIYLDQYTVIHVARLSDTDGEGRIFSSMNTNALIGSWSNFYDRMYANGWVYQGVSLPSGLSTLDWKIAVGTVDLNNMRSSFRQNGLYLASNVNVAATLNGVSLGAWEYFGGIYEKCRCEIAEVLIYNRVLTEKDIIKVENYLNAKYSIFSQQPNKLGRIYFNSFPKFPSNPRAFWRLNNPNGLNSVTDNSDNQLYNLNVFNGYSSVPGKIKNGFYFQNSTQGMWTNQQLWNFINQQTSFSVSYWIKLENVSSTQTLMGNAFGTMGFHFDYYPSGNPYGVSFRMHKALGFTGQTSDWHLTHSNEALNTNTWYHIVGTYDLSTTTMRLYINGVLKNINTSAVIGNQYPNNNSWHGFALNGSVLPGGKEYGSGQSYDAVGFWTRTLNPSEILSLYNSGNGLENEVQSKGKLSITKGKALILEDILPFQSSTIGSLQYDISNFYRTIFTTENLDKIVRNEALQSNNRINYNLGYMPERFTATFDYKAGGGSGADGGYFYFLSGGSTPTTGPNGKYMGGGTTGTNSNSYRIHFDEYTAENQQLAVSWNGYFNIIGGTSNGAGGVLIGTVGTGNALGFSFGDNTWRTIKIQFNQGIFNIYVNDILRLTCTDSNYNIRNKTNFNFGLGGYVGGVNNFHSFKNFKLYGTII